MDTLLRKHLWIVDFLAVGLCAIFMGRAAASMVESKYLLSLPTPRPAPHLVTPERETVFPKAIDDVIKRNVFCSTCPPILLVEPAKADPSVPTDPQKTTLPLQLVAVNYVAPPWGFEYASATLRDTDTKEVGAVRAGEKIRGAVVTGIEETRVHLDNAGKPEYVDLLDAETPAAGAAAVPPPTAAAGPNNDAFSQELDRGIKKITENTYEIQRATLESVLGNMSLLARSARIVPEMRDGKAAGFRLYSVRTDGPFAKIGMQNGDVLSAINGLEITSPEKALEVYSKLKSASHLSLGIERNGQRLTKEYSIR